MKVFKLIVHQKSFSAEDLVINPKDFPGIKIGDIVEIYHPEDEFSRLLLQVTAFKEDFQTRESISIEQSIASAFQLRTYYDVHINVVDPTEVALDSVELTFKDQYMGRSEMWRLKNSLVNTCVYLNKKIEFCGGSNRCQVYEMWSQGDRVACGVINDDTKVVFRSSTSMVYLFIQMSSEMWDFDIHGDLYFEKAVNGFLSDLFQKWKRNGCNHEVTIVLFSRTFYTATSLEEFPIYMRECLQQDYKGRFYEDFYRVAVQNERYDDWSSTLVQLRRLFTDYQKIVLDYHRRPGENVPNAVNSTAAQGNFLEVLNMSLNVFEKHYLDRSFDRTGQLSVVITPGVGVFEVDRELTNVTKQRVIDNGVGSDLVCVGEQPLHAVPLLKFHNKDPLLSTVEDYSMPHWINLSFYSTNKKVAYSNFIPRIKLPPKKSKSSPTHDGSIIQTAKPRLLPEEECMPNSLFDYDAYDAQVFQLPPVHPTRFSRTLQRSNSRQKKTSITLTDPVQVGTTSSKVIKRKMSDPDIHHTVNHSTSPIGTSAPRSAAISIPHYQQGEVSPEQSVAVAHDVKSRVFAVQNDILETELSPPQRPVIGSAGSPSSPLHMQVNLLRPGRALINPFDPSHVTIKLTSNRRRWTHIFPKGPSGVLIQQHHYQAVPANASSEQHHVYEGSGGSTISTSPCNETTPPPYSNGTLARSASQTNFQDSSKNKGSSRPNALSPVPSVKGNKSLTLLWGATGEQEWTPALTTGVDWKSLTIPACLPITTDYFPDKRSLQNDYLVSDYNLLPDDVNADFAQQRAIYKKPLTTREVFRELVSQRLAQGFQLILLQKSSTNKQAQTPGSASNIAPSGVSSLVMSRPCHIEPTEEYFLSIGRIFHKITLSGSTITVTRYRPRHPYPPFNIHYRYRFQAPHHDTYEISWVSFTTEKLENFNWNYLDHYICTRGDTDFQLAEAQKYWRFRMYLLPLNQQATKKILSDDVEHCDIYLPFSAEEQNNLIGGFLKFLETFVNKIKRPVVSKKPRNPASFLSAAAQQTLISRRHSASTIMFSHNNSQASVIGNSPFRERLGSSNRIGDKFRPRSGSKVMERVKADSGTGGRVSPATEAALTDKSLTQHLSPQDADGFQHNSDFLDEIPKSDIRMLKKTANLSEILEAMSHPQSGVGFLAHHPSLPSFTFVSAEAVQWLAMHVEGIDRDETAVSILQERLICHASGDFSHPLIIGFYLYHCVHDEKETQKEDVEYFPPLGDVHSFENEWLEVEITHPIGWCQSTLNTAVPPGDLIPKFLNDPLPGPCEEDPESHRSSQVPLYKHTHLEIDIGSKSDRVEWGHARYQSIYKPTKAYELVVQWVTASGTIVSELIMFWARKAQSCGLQLIPIPADPLALPFTHKSDPLRGPIFIPLNIECLLEGRNFLFQDFPSKSWEARLFYFQESILEKFGFVSCTVEASPVIMTTVGGLTLAHHRQYVHLSGVTFILMPSYPCEHRSNSGVKTSIVSRQLSIHATRGYPVNSDILSSPHEEYITRHVSGKNKDDYGTENKVGFLWSWNHMLSKRWRSWTTAAAGDESFQIKFLKDFREFCANYDNRLKQFWDSSWEIKEKL